MRMQSPQLMFFPETAFWYLTSTHREIRQNTYNLRDVFYTLIEKRRKDISDPTFKDKGDFLTILLSDDLFKDDNRVILDECLTFFFAGSQTTSMTHGNMIFYLMRDQKLLNRVREEFQSVIVRPYKESNNTDTFDWFKGIDYTTMQNLSLYHCCFLESLRIEPPVTVSSANMFSEDVVLANGKLSMKKGDQFYIHNLGLHHTL